MDAYLRAFDAKSGKELWQGRLPVPGVANPMTYLWNGEQYVVIAAGGHSESGTSIGDSVVAFRLPRAGEAPSLWSKDDRSPGRAVCEQRNNRATRDRARHHWTLALAAPPPSQPQERACGGEVT